MKATKDFKTIEGGKGHRVLWIESGRLEECMSHFYDGGFDGIGIGPRMGYSFGNVEFLREHTGVEHVVLLDATGLDLTALPVLSGLSYLQLDGFSGDIDFGVFPRLRHLRVQWTPNMRFSTQPALERLALWGFKPKCRNLTGLPAFKNLHILEVVQSPIVSLSGIQRFSQLERIELAYLSKLEDISAIAELPRLSAFQCGNCKRIRDYNQIGAAHGLTSLRLNNCGKLPTLEFLDSLTRLEEFRFVGTDVEDGDLTRCLRLKSVSFSDKKHFTHTLAKLKEAIGDKTP